MSSVNHPEHYQGHEFECVDFIDDRDLNFYLGNAIKYLTRAGRKCGSNKVEDLEKAKWYVKRHWEKHGNRANVYFTITSVSMGIDANNVPNKISTTAYIMDQHLERDIGDVIGAICDEGDLSKAIALINDMLNELCAVSPDRNITYTSDEQKGE